MTEQELAAMSEEELDALMQTSLDYSEMSDDELQARMITLIDEMAALTKKQGEENANQKKERKRKTNS